MQKSINSTAVSVLVFFILSCDIFLLGLAVGTTFLQKSFFFAFFPVFVSCRFLTFSLGVAGFMAFFFVVGHCSEI